MATSAQDRPEDVVGPRCCPHVLRSLVHSKHKMISMGSAAALKNLAGQPCPESRYHGIGLSRAETSCVIKTIEACRAVGTVGSLVVTSTQSDNIFDRNRTICHRSGSLQLGQGQRVKETEEKPQPEALMERLTLEETPLTSDQPVNNSLKYTEQETPPIADQTEQPVNYSLKYPEEANRTTVCATQKKIQRNPRPIVPKGTPYNFSTATSLSDLLTPDTNNKSLEAKSGGLSPVGSLTHDDNIVSVPIPSQVKEESREGKVVTFETPLMFSRCSSLGSLSSCEPPDDRSSVVSEFSRMTSGMVSPSELPDSPTQTVPPSPHCVKPPMPLPVVKPVSVFEERVSVFKEESTPVQFSTATSLSGLDL
ncbi:adenomatous polyposis coli protein-like [Homalodisca vitripennis]|uniref:adenomatous polyposis coli protein-like n=1 Tax=Homalodisca vitripennis TaxID=197043 RepID=UPI001EEA8598|nr:adenomatous polyposis coli protein-like [Homalodisca vitripennis]